VHLHILHIHKDVSMKTDFLCGLCKKTKFDAKISFFAMFFNFSANATNMLVFYKTLREHIEYEDIQVNIFLKCFKISKFVS
jgi:hypothetical protein